ncbi:MAG: hypothetical protein IPI63_01015 [Methanothrix sp.]|uniref:hypothetical protein n=1 Tax=Methanothrix sp. TaxID=90426 RepID=UPI0025F23366|nr:hypothetical protein [Methanothrix sp.]MBK7385367.1 hypothetical protein [Methanothrix sp.]
MRGRAKVLDSRFMEFIECLQKIGELKNMVRMIDSLAEIKNNGYEWLHIEPNIGSNIGLNIGSDIGLNNGSDIGLNNGSDIGLNIGSDIGLNNGSDIRLNNGSDIGLNNSSNIKSNRTNNNGIDLLYPFWQNGWIQIRETERKGKDWHIKEYSLSIRLEEIVAYFEQDSHERLLSAGYAEFEQDAQNNFFSALAARFSYPSPLDMDCERIRSASSSDKGDIAGAGYP